MVTGFMMALIPSTRVMFITLDPRILPRDIPPDPFTAATRLTSNSGAEVAKDTIVNPTMTGLTANITAVEAAPSTSREDPTHSRVSPSISIKACVNILFM